MKKTVLFSIMILCLWVSLLFVPTDGLSLYYKENAVFIHGKVFDAYGNPIPFAKVMLISQEDTLSRISNYSDYTPNIGVFKFLIPCDMVTSVKHRNYAVPQKMVLHQNYPNPFNPSTVIMYELFESTEVTLEVFNITGQRIKLLESSHKHAGKHTVVWDGRDSYGYYSASGIYLYRLKAYGRTQVRKMLLLDSGGSGICEFPYSTLKESQKNAAMKQKDFKLLVVKKGYKQHCEDHFIIPIDDDLTDIDSLEVNIELEREFTPGDYFPLKKGNTWSYVTASKEIKYYRRNEILPEHLFSEWNTSVIGTEKIDGKQYYILDKFTPFIPLRNYDKEKIKPVVRITDDGDLVLRYYDSDTTVYEFSKPNFYTENLLTSIDTYIVEQECIIKTPAGTYDDCCRVSVRSDNEYDVWFSRKAGPVYYSYIYDTSEPKIFLKHAEMGDTCYGVTEGTLSGETITNSDITEIYRILMDPWWFETHTGGTISNIYSWNLSGDFTFSSDNIDVMLVPKNLPLPFKVMNPADIQLKANKYWEYSYFQIDELMVEDEKITVEIKYDIKLSKDHPGGVLAGCGFHVEFTPKFGMWISKSSLTWISKIAK